MDTVLIADDHPLFRDALKKAVVTVLGEVRILEADSLDALQDVLDQGHDVELLFLDLHMPGVNGFSGLSFIGARYPDIPILMVSADEDSSVINTALELGAMAFIPKSAPLSTMATAMTAVLEGQIWRPMDTDVCGRVCVDQKALTRRVAELTPQQFRVLRMVADGMLNKQIAYELDVSEATVKAHLTAIMRKMQVRTRTQAVLMLKDMDLDQPHLRL